jgi:DNA-binding transcriptional LysR family regulator
MELRQLEAFVAVAEERNFTRAAGRLHLAQSGLSATIRSLERELRARLFVRTTRHVGLTPAGEALLIEARQTLASARAAVEAVAAVEGLQKGTLTLGTMQASSFVDLAGFLSRFHEAYPGVSLKLQQASASDLGQMLRDHVVDLIFTLESDQPAPEILSLPMVRSRVVVACRSDHVLADEAAVELRVLVDHPLVSFPLGWGVRTLTDQALRSIGAEPHYAFEVNDTSTVLDLVQAGIRCCLSARSPRCAPTGIASGGP